MLGLCDSAASAFLSIFTDLLIVTLYRNYRKRYIAFHDTPLCFDITSYNHCYVNLDIYFFSVLCSNDFLFYMSGCLRCIAFHDIPQTSEKTSISVVYSFMHACIRIFFSFQFCSGCYLSVVVTVLCV